MRLGVIVEGRSEYKALPTINRQLCSASPVTGIYILHATYDPHAPPGRVVRACRSRVSQLAGRRCNQVVVLIDREARDESCRAIAETLEEAFRNADLGVPVRVVVKDRCFENWLIADLAALRALPARFEISERFAGRVEPNRADQVDALALLKRAAKGDSYGKVNDAERILAKAKVERIAQHSRSFRCFLGRLGHPVYGSGSCAPAFP